MQRSLRSILVFSGLIGTFVSIMAFVFVVIIGDLTQVFINLFGPIEIFMDIGCIDPDNKGRVFLCPTPSLMPTIILLLFFPSFLKSLSIFRILKK